MDLDNCSVRALLKITEIYYRSQKLIVHFYYKNNDKKTCTFTWKEMISTNLIPKLIDETIIPKIQKSNIILYIQK
jgi:hypothetical protein